MKEIAQIHTYLLLDEKINTTLLTAHYHKQLVSLA